MDPATWSPWTYWLYAWAMYCAGSMVYFWFRFGSLEKRVVKGDKKAKVAYNAALKGFPNMVLAKMFGKRPLK